jgi:hypothetical protein
MGDGSRELQFCSFLEGLSKVEIGPRNRSFCPRKNGHHCGKDATKWLICERPSSDLVDKCPKPGYMFLISLFGLGNGKKLWHSITRSSRSTCQQNRRTARREGSGGKRDLLGGTESFQRVAEFGPLHGTGKWREVPAVKDVLSDTEHSWRASETPRGG